MTATLLPRENVRFLLGPAPTLLLTGAPCHGDLPPIELGTAGPAAWWRAARPCAGWRIVPRLTLCLVDGPEGAGCLIPTLLEPTDMGAMLHWCDAVGAAGGAVVVSLDTTRDTTPETIPGAIDWNALISTRGARGGFLTEIQPTAHPAEP